MSQQTPRPIFEKIVDATCKYYNCTEDELKFKTTNTETVYRRKIVIALARQHTTMSYKKIAVSLGLKNHTWPMEIVKEIESSRIIYQQIAHDLKNVMQIVDNLV